MLLGPISLLDCLVFVIFLVPQLLYQASLGLTLLTVVKVLPFLIFKLPFQFLHERCITDRSQRSPFCRNATIFQDIVVRCVRYAFANIPASVGRVFFSKNVSHPFFRFRLLRHGHLHSPISYTEIHRHNLSGLWAIADRSSDPDVIIYYAHGGGFSMGSAYFYLEFLMAWLTRLQARGYHNPAVFALEYTLVPDAKFPTQLDQTRAGFKFLTDTFGEASASKIVVSGDSAGATLILSMLLQSASTNDSDSPIRPGLAVLLSPWTHLISPLNQDTPSDYLSKPALQLYATQYAGHSAKTDDIISPGLSYTRWRRCSPNNGYRIIYGAEEVFARGIEEMTQHIRRDGGVVKTHKREAGIHAWPVVDLFLGASREERVAGLDLMVECVVGSSMGPKR